MRTQWGARLLLLLLAAAPAAEATLTAGTPSISPDAPITPDEGRATLTVPLAFACDPSEVLTEPMQLTLEVDPGHEGITVTGPLAFEIPAAACQGPASEPWEDEASFDVAVSRAVPGETLMPIEVTGAIEDAQLAEGGSVTVEAAVAAAYAGLLTVTIDRTVIGVAGSGSAVLTVANAGNALTQVDVRLVSVTGLPVGVPAASAVTVPSPLMLETPNLSPDGTSAEMVVSFRDPGRGWAGESVVQLELVPKSTRSADAEGEAVTVSLLFHEAGAASSHDSPAPVAPMLGLLLAGLAAARRRA